MFLNLGNFKMCGLQLPKFCESPFWKLRYTHLKTLRNTALTTTPHFSYDSQSSLSEPLPNLLSASRTATYLKVTKDKNKLGFANIYVAACLALKKKDPLSLLCEATFLLANKEIKVYEYCLFSLCQMVL